MSAATVLLILHAVDLLAAAVQMKLEDRARFDRIRDDIRRFIEEGRDPTPEEFDALMQRSRDLTERIRRST